MWFSTFPSVAFIILGLFGFLSTVVVASTLCDDPSTIKTVTTVDLTKDKQDWFYCYSSLAGSTVNNCYVHLTPAGSETTTIEAHLYNTSSKEKKAINDAFTLKMEGNPGIYKFVTSDTRQATGYITEASKDENCVTMFKCFTGGPWGGSESTGEYAVVMCKDPKMCRKRTSKHLKKNIKSKLLTGNAKLKKLNQDKCLSKGIKP